MFCTAIASAIRSPNASPSPNAAPTPMPSAAECAVITTTISNACRAARPLNDPSVSASCPPITREVAKTKSAPTAAPPAVCAPLRAAPSSSRLALAPSITPEATALAAPSQRSRPGPNQANGRAPSPVASAVPSATSPTTATPPDVTSLRAA